MTDDAMSLWRKGIPITRTYMNHNRTVLVTVWPNRQVDVQMRRTAASEWGMPIRCHEETDDVSADNPSRT